MCVYVCLFVGLSACLMFLFPLFMWVKEKEGKREEAVVLCSSEPLTPQFVPVLICFLFGYLILKVVHACVGLWVGLSVDPSQKIQL